jgi:hypothetical protein
MIGDKALLRLNVAQWRVVFAIAFEALGTIGAGEDSIDRSYAAREALLVIRDEVKKFVG